MGLDRKYFTRMLYNTAIAVCETLKDKRAIASICIYAAPIIYRFVTKNPHLHIFPEIDISNEFIPANLPEKLLINTAAPGYTGIVLREKYNKVVGKDSIDFKNRIRGAFEGWAILTAIQGLGYLLGNPIGPHGQPIVEPLTYLPINLAIALTLSPLLSYAIDYLNLKKNVI